MTFTVVDGARTTRVNVVLAIRNDLVRYGIEQMLRALDIVGQVRTGNDLAHAVESVADVDSDVLVVPLADVDERTRPLLSHAGERGVRVLVLLDDADTAAPGWSGRLTGLRAAGFVTGSGLSGEILRSTLTRMSDGEVPLPPQLAHSLLAMAATGGAGDVQRPTPRMSPREQQVLVLLVDGLSNKQIARRLKISEHGAKRLVANILAKLDCPNRTLAVARALREGLYDQCRYPEQPAG